MKKKQDWLILGVISLIAALLLAVTNDVTKDRIALQAAAAQDSARLAVLPGAVSFEEIAEEDPAPLDSVYVGYAADGSEMGHVAQITVNGFGGPIEVVLGMDTAGAVTGMSAGGSGFAETAGLGTKVKEPDFTGRFVGLSSAPKAGENVDTISGATISSSAVIAGASKCYEYMQRYLTGYVAPEAETLTAEKQVTVTRHGFASDIDVTVGILPDGSIEGVLIGGDSFAETAGLGEKVLDKEFRDQFKGKSGVLAYGDGIDAIAGATITSDAVLAAINEALNGAAPAAADASQQAAEGTEKTADATAAATADATGGATAPAPKKDDAPIELAANEMLGVSQNGMGGELKVKLTMDGDKIAKIDVVSHNETAGLSDPAIEKIPTAILAAQSTEVDAVAGATITSKAIMEAVADALAQVAAPAGSAAANEMLGVSQNGMGGELKVKLTMDGDKIAKIDVVSHNETAGLSDPAIEKIPAAILAAQSAEVDAVAGATITSKAIMEAVADALAQAK